MVYVCAMHFVKLAVLLAAIGLGVALILAAPEIALIAAASLMVAAIVQRVARGLWDLTR